MPTKIILFTAIISTIYLTCAFAAEPKFIDPDTTKFTFTSEAKGPNKFCNLVVSAVKVPMAPPVARGPVLAGGVSLNAVAWRRGTGDYSMIFGFEVKAFETTLEHGVPAVPKSLKIRDAKISSDIFPSEGAVYTVKDAGLGGFTGTMIRGSYFVNVSLSDGRSVSYVIRGDETLLDAADKWTKCSIQIAK
jgi:hypothetical protein